MIETKQNEWWRKNVKPRYNEFVSWLGSQQNNTRLFLKDFVINNNIKSILDTACGPCIDYEVLKDTGIDYIGLDSTPILVSLAEVRDIPVRTGNVESLPFENEKFDLVYGRHILEHLEYYEKAVSEAVRCSKKYVMYTLFLEHKDKDEIRWINEMYANLYDLNKIKKFSESLNCDFLHIKHESFDNQSIIILTKKD